MECDGGLLPSSSRLKKGGGGGERGQIYMMDGILEKWSSRKKGKKIDSLGML
jgi:hypothetical protein